MLTTTPHLQVRRPSPTTSEFTVSTEALYPRPQYYLLNTLLWVVRLLVLSASLLLLHAQWTALYPPCSSPSSPSAQSAGDFNFLQRLDSALTYIQSLPPGRLAAHLARSPLLPPWVLLPLCIGASYAALLRAHKTERLLVLRGLGIQTWSAGRTVVASPATRFIPTDKVRDVLINEAFLGNEVRFCLIVIVEGEDDVVVVFPGILPNRDIIMAVWRGVCGCLWEGKKPGGKEWRERLED